MVSFVPCGETVWRLGELPSLWLAVACNVAHTHSRFPPPHPNSFPFDICMWQFANYKFYGVDRARLKRVSYPPYCCTSTHSRSTSIGLHLSKFLLFTSKASPTMPATDP